MVCFFFAFADCRQHSWVTGCFGGDATDMAQPGFLGGNDLKIERGVDRD